MDGGPPGTQNVTRASLYRGRALASGPAPIFGLRRYQPSGPPCDALTDVDVRETNAAVTVTVRAGRVPGARCVPGVEAVVGTFLVIAELAEPLGGRTLVDGARR